MPSFFDNAKRIIHHSSIWLIYALIHVTIFNGLVAVTGTVLLADGLIHATIWAIISILLSSITRYSNFKVLNLYQRVINYIALAVLAIGTWLSIGYYLVYASFGNEIAVKFIPVLAVKAFIGLLIYLLLIQQLQQLHTEETATKTESEQETESGAISRTYDNKTEAALESESKNQPNKELLERIAVKSGSRIHVIMIDEILHLQADGDYVQIHTLQGRFIKEQTMKYFETHLPPNQFVRVHRSVIVNIKMISRIELYEKQSQQITLNNGQQIKTSPSGYKALKTILKL